MTRNESPLVLSIGGNSAVMEGIAQTLASSGFRVASVASADEAVGAVVAESPLILLLPAELASAHPGLLRLPRREVGSTIVWRDSDSPTTPLALSTRRYVLAELRLPLERQRLVSLARHVANRAVELGRDGDGRAAPPEQPLDG